MAKGLGRRLGVCLRGGVWVGCMEPNQEGLHLPWVDFGLEQVLSGASGKEMSAITSVC